MRKLLLTLVFALIVSLSGYSQYYVDYGFSVGATGYLGEFGGGKGERRDFVADLEFSYTRWTVGGFYRYRISPKIGVKIALNYIRLSGDDAKSDNPARRARNLNFKNDMFELILNGEFYIYKANDVGGTGRYRTDFHLYVFGGVGAFYSNPQGQTSGGDWVSLKPLQTEGASYSSFNLTLPLGIGFYYTLNRKYRLGLELGWRTTFTDYIDDASTVYVNTEDGISNKTNQELLDEINAENPDLVKPLTQDAFGPGKKRGDPSHNDSYLTATVNFSWAIRGRSKFYKAKHSWVLGKKKRRRRKSRAKF
ncbi:MAG: hypothetical protein COA97_07305 [Flavobacteriales bacterium]|nr:MAG: hypothetical protein COA97_07305 [Flavobacteriales bacterium]